MKIKTIALIATLSAFSAQAEERQLFWGDTHLHTSNSFDVYAFGTPNATLDTAYNFAKGLPVINTSTDTIWKLNTPLDFLVVADHAEILGSVGAAFDDNSAIAKTRFGQIIRELAPNQSDEELLGVYKLISDVGTGLPNKYNLTGKDAYVDLHGGDKRKAAWQKNIDAADKHNSPGKFTAFIGWEWTSQPGGGNLHRVVFTPGDARSAGNYLPFSLLESMNPEDLWTWLDKTSTAFGTDFIAIPHNSNVSNGAMFPLITQTGEALTTDYANRRMRWEKVVEVTQIKGDSETHPILSPTDEFADFETFEFLLRSDGKMANITEADYARSALKRGLEVEKQIGANPYKFGMIGSTDAHAAISGVEEDNFSGKNKLDAKPENRARPTGLGGSIGWDMSAAGYVAAWADENTRQSLFEAFKRREVYASTGPRIALRFFGGFDFSKRDAKPEKLATAGYKKGVSMGGELIQDRKRRTPSFLIQATKDPRGGNIDRIQVIKGWLDVNGKAQEKVFNVAASDGREIKNNQLVAVGNTVDVSTGRYTNSIGDTELATRWEDPEFNPEQSAFYYVRVLQIPTPRYSLFDAIALGIDPEKTGKPLTIQERAYSSPIWYTPQLR